MCLEKKKRLHISTESIQQLSSDTSMHLSLYKAQTVVSGQCTLQRVLLETLQHVFCCLNNRDTCSENHFF